MQYETVAAQYALHNVPANAPAVFFAAAKRGPAAIRRDLNKNGCHSPYSYTTAAAVGSNDAAPPPAYASIVPGTVHVQLSNRCEFIMLPEIQPLDSPAVMTPYTLFLGQIRFETTAAELRWLLRKVCGVTATKVEPRGPGCFIVHLSSEEDVDSIRSLHKRLLFDHSGVWFARTEHEVDAMDAYVTTQVPYLSRRAHLPRDSMVVEEQKTRIDLLADSATTTFSAPQSPGMLSASPSNSQHITTPFGSTPPSPYASSTSRCTPPPPPPYASF